MQQDIACIQNELNDTREEWKRIEKALKDARQTKKAFKKTYDDEKKKRTYSSHMIQNQKEAIMKDLGIDRGAAHGGDLQGRGCTNFVQKADEFFDRCLEIDEKAVRDGTAQASLEEVQKMNRHFKQLAILTDCILHDINMDFDDVENYEGNLISDVETHLKEFVWLWNYLRLSFAGSKIHLVKDHCLEQTRKWKGIGSFNEEFMEADHVVGNREMRTYASLRSDVRKAQAISKREMIHTDPAVLKIKKEVSANKKRKRLTPTKREELMKRRAEVIEEVHRLMLMYSVDSRRDSLDCGRTTAQMMAQITDYWTLTTDRRN